MIKGFNSVGNNLETISLSIMEKITGPLAQWSSIGRIDIVLGALLARCANNKCMFKPCAFMCGCLT